jgi:hypothetical protein
LFFESQATVSNNFVFIMVCQSLSSQPPLSESGGIFWPTVIKPGPARRVDPGPGQPGGWTGSGLLKDRPVQQPGKTRSTRRVDP